MTSPITLDAKKTVLVFLDMQNRWIRGDAPPFRVRPERAALVQNCARMLQGARQKGLPVIFVKVEWRKGLVDTFTPVLGTDSSRWPPKAWLADFPGATDIIDELKPLPAEYIVVKRRVSAFYATDLEVLLRCLGIDTLIVGGVATDGAVEATVRNARDRDYNLVVLKDCCGASSDEIHEKTVRYVFNRMGWVTTAGDALAAIQ